MLQPGFDFFQFRFCQEADIAAWRAPFVANLENAGKLVQSEPYAKRPLSEPDAIKRCLRVFAVTVSRACRFGNQTYALIMAQRVGANAREAREFA